jgi:hypothetical protein
LNVSQPGVAEQQEAAAQAEGVETQGEPVGEQPIAAAIEAVEPVSVPAEGGAPLAIEPSMIAIAPSLSCYSVTELEAEFRQGEIITGLEQVVRIFPDGNAEVKQHPFAVIFSQDCDLAADHRARQAAGGAPVMNGILLFEAYPLDGFIGTLGFNSNERKQVKQNNNTRYHVLEPAAVADDLQAQGFAGLAIDFRRYFTLTADDMAGQLALTARRRSRLVSPYVEHLQSRALHYLGRVALPDSN